MKTTNVKILILFAGLVTAAGTAALTGCAGSSSSTTNSNSNGGSTTGTTASAVSPATTVFVTQNMTGAFGSLPQILQFAAGANGTVTPTSTLTLPSGEYIDAVAVDASGQIYVSGDLTSGASVIQVFAAGASGTATPVRTITIASGNAPAGMVVDSSGQLYTADQAGSVKVYASTANGTATATRTISGALTTLGYGEDIAVDSAGTIYVATGVVTGSTESGEIQVFASGATGNVAPQRIITNSSVYLGVATDSSGNLYASLDVPVANSTSSIVQYAAGATGAATPTRTIAGSATGLNTAGALRVDGAGNIYVANQLVSYYSATFTLLKFGPAASGNTAPIASMSSASWTAAGPEIAIK